MIQRPKTTSSGLNESDHKSLVSELTKYAEEGASDSELKEFRETFIAEKKKATPNKEVASESITQKTSGDSEQKIGSLDIGTPKVKSERALAVTEKENVLGEKPRRMTTDITQFQKEDEAFKQNVNQKIANYRQATKVSPQEKEEAVLELNKAKEQEGVLNNIKSVGSQLGNFLTTGVFKKEDPLNEEKKQAKEYFIQNKIKATPEQIAQKADEIFVDKKILSKKQDKINSYLGGLDDQEKTYLEVDADTRFSSLSKDRKEASDRLAMNKNTFIQLTDELKKPITDEDKAMLETEIGKVAKYIDEDYKLANKSTSELGTAEDELNAFKRNYGIVDNIKSRVIGSVSDLAINTVSGLDYISKYTNPIGAEVRTAKVQEGIEKAQKGMQEYREGFRPEIDEMTLKNFPQYFTDLLANQSGTLLAIGATGGIAGASTLGLGQAGQTYSDMYKENRTSAKYSPAQMAIAPLISGVSTGVLSELPTIQTLKNAGNVWKSMLKTEATKELTEQAVKKTSREILARIGEDTGKEVSTELMDNIVQNAVKKDVLGDKNVGYFDNSWKVIKDTALLTGMLNAGALPQVTMSAVKMFNPSNINKVLDSNGSKIIELSKQLDNVNLDDSAKKMVEAQISELTKSSTKIINNTVKKIDGLTEDEVKKVVTYEGKKQQLANKAQEVKENPDLNNETKKVLLQGLEEQYINVSEKSNEIINAEIQKPTKATEQIESQPQAEVQKAEQESVELNTSDKFKKTVDLFNQINETEGGSKKRALVKERKAFLEEHPTVKYVDDNIREVTKQLEEKGELKKSGDCP